MGVHIHKNGDGRKREKDFGRYQSTHKGTSWSNPLKHLPENKQSHPS
jgi:hypothetical protein